MTANPVVVEHLTVEYPTRHGTVVAVNDVSFEISPGGITALVGESGSGKSTAARSLMKAISHPGRITAGRVVINGEDITSVPERKLRKIRGNHVAMILQNPMTSLNPLLTVGRQLEDSFLAHNPDETRASARSTAEDVLELVRMSPERMNAYPHQLSGGMTQRIMIATGLICGARILIADEPTTALDVLVEAQFMQVLRDLCQEIDAAVVLVSHDLGLVKRWADEIMVMYAGRIVETGTSESIFRLPRHPYTQALIDSTPDLQSERGQLYRIRGLPPDLANLPSGCAYHPRCPSAMEACRLRTPDLLAAPSDSPLQEPSRAVACLLYRPANGETVDLAQ